MQKKRIILIGLGPHARRIYYPFLEKHARNHNIELSLVVDVQSQAEAVQNYLTDRSLQPKQLHFIDQATSTHEIGTSPLAPVLRDATSRGCNGMIIASEARTHEPYISWALDHNLDILTDKPITTPTQVSTSVRSAESIYDHYANLERKLAQSTANLIVQCQRRSHAGYQLIQDYLTEFLQTYEVPISYLNVYHADGMWPMPWEMFARENHPYKYGYGKLMHSGYHFVDLFAWLASLNNAIPHKAANNMEMFVQTFRPADLLHQTNQRDYERLFFQNGLGQSVLGNSSLEDFFTAEKQTEARSLGELDAYIQCQLRRDDAVVTTGSIDLQQNSFSRRAWAEEPADVYKGNGRVRHERVNIQVGNLLNIQVHSYQSHETTRQETTRANQHRGQAGSVNTSQIEEGGSGHDAHFDIHIYRNSGIVGGKAYEKFAIGSELLQQHQGDQTYLGHNEKAREKLFVDFLNGHVSDSHFSTHRLTNLILAKIYRCMAQAHTDHAPYTVFDI